MSENEDRLLISPSSELYVPEQKKKKVVLGASWSIIEPLGAMHIAEIARQEGWEPIIEMGHEPHFEKLEERINQEDPDLLGVTVYTGNHGMMSDFLERMKEERPHMEIVVGGPHATAFPKEAIRGADYAVVSEGFGRFREILRGEAPKGVLPLLAKEVPFPRPYRDQFYEDNPKHRDNAIKNVITATGCPFKCTYCYNNFKFNPESMPDDVDPAQVDSMRKVLGAGKSGVISKTSKAGRGDAKLFPVSARTVDDVIEEVDDIMRLAPDTQLLFFQDDIFGNDMPWLREFHKKYKARVPYHIMTRFELMDGTKKSGSERAELIRESGCTGLTFAIESENPAVRKEVLKRATTEEQMYGAIEKAQELGFTMRTFSMVGLPYGASPTETPVALEQDLRTLDLNSKIRAKTGGLPTIAWASILVPYPNTAIDVYSAKHGFYGGDYSDIEHSSYRKNSVLKFVNQWVGPELTADTPGVWMEGQEEADYRLQLTHLMNMFPHFARFEDGRARAEEYLAHGLATGDFSTERFLPEFEREYKDGHILADKLRRGGKFDSETTNNAVRYHIYDYELFMVKGSADGLGECDPELEDFKATTAQAQLGVEPASKPYGFEK